MHKAADPQYDIAKRGKMGSVRQILIGMLMVCSVAAADDRNATLETMIGRMVVVGFDGESLEANAPIVKDLQRYHLGGVILFDRHFHERQRVKNVRSPAQVKALSAQLRRYAPEPLLIAVDQEGGRVQRLKPAYGFTGTPCAAAIGGEDNVTRARELYDAMGQMLQDAGISVDFAPVVDLAVNPDNFVIVGLERSYGKTPQKVVRFASIALDALRWHGVIGALKHFPGHGSSRGDTHAGFVDVSDTWQPIELEPYRRLIAAQQASMIMTAHVFNRRLDPKYPATLSHAVITDLLRGELGFEGVVISDDMQMEAIARLYTLKETVTLAINAGVDLLPFGNQLKQIRVSEIVDAVAAQVRAGAIDPAQIVRANRRVEALLRGH